MSRPEMEVRLIEQPRGDFKIVIYLRSQMKAEIRTLGELNPAVAQNSTDLINRVGILAGAVAERQGLMYGDNHDPKECHDTAIALFKEAIIDYAQHKPALQASVRAILGDPENHIGQTAHVSAKTH